MVYGIGFQVSGLIRTPTWWRRWYSLARASASSEHAAAGMPRSRWVLEMVMLILLRSRAGFHPPRLGSTPAVVLAMLVVFAPTWRGIVSSRRVAAATASFTRRVVVALVVVVVAV